MRKIVKNIFVVLAYALVLTSFVSAGWVALPDEVKNQVPQMNDWLALITGVITMILGSGGIAVVTVLKNTEKKTDLKVNLLADNYLQVVEELKLLRKEKEQDRVEKSKLEKSIQEITKLVKVDLQTKLSNPLIEETAKKLINGVLGGDNDEQKW